MKKVTLLLIFLVFFFMSTVEAHNNPGSIIIKDNVDLKISGAGFGNDSFDFELKYHFNEHDPGNLYWKMDLSTFKFSDSVANFSGSGIQNTRPFTVFKPWEVQWDAKGSSFSIYLHTASGSIEKILASQREPGSGSSYYPNTGEFYLGIISNGDWDISVVYIED